MIRLHGAGEEGVGEDVTYEAAEHDLQQARGPVLPLAGHWTLDTFSQHLATLPLFDHEPEQHAYLDYRRWAFESAALDLALRQAGLLARRRRRPGAAAADVRRLDAARRAGHDRAAARVARPLPRRSASSSTRRPTGRTS